MYEEILSFDRDSTEDGRNQTFFVDMLGKSFCDRAYAMSRSPLYAIEYITKGSGTLHINGEQSHPSQNDVYFLHANSRHQYDADKKKPWTKYWIAFHGYAADALVDLYQLNGIYYIQNCSLKMSFEELFAVADQYQTMPSRFHKEISILVHAMLKKMFLAIRPQEHKRDSVSQIISFMEDNLCNSITLQDIARQMGVSSTQAIRVFKTSMNTSPIHFFLCLRIKKAQALLEHTALPIKKIASLLGFYDEYHFARQFKKIAGLPPGHFRKSWFGTLEH